MRKLTHLELMYPGSILIKGVGHIRCPRVEEIVDPENDSELDGETIYNGRINVLLITKAKFLESISEALSETQLKSLDELPLFILLCLFEDVRNTLQDALSYFIEEKLVYLPDTFCFAVVSDTPVNGSNVIGKIDMENFFEVKNLILVRNHITPPKDENGKRRSKRMVEFDKKLEAGRKQSKKYQDEQEAMRLGNIVSKVASRSSYTFPEVYSMTVYQLYDRFYEINAQTQLDVYMKRWCTWGKDDFDFSLWYKTLASE